MGNLRLVAEIAYTERTPDGILRHPFYRTARGQAGKGINLRRPCLPKPMNNALASKPVSKRPGRRASGSETDKVLFPEQGVTKAELAAYYAAVAPAMLDHIATAP